MASDLDLRPAGSRVWRLLDNPIIWESSRVGLDQIFGLYARRIRIIEQWGVLDDDTSVLDIGCGIGQYSRLATGRYLGIDMNERYIRYARARRKGPKREFRSGDVGDLLREHARFDLVLMVDFLHHLSDDQCLTVLRTAAQLANRAVLSFEPVTHQPNRIGRWIVEHDRGDYVRPLPELHALFYRSGLRVADSVKLRLGPINTRAIRCPTRLARGVFRG